MTQPWACRTRALRPAPPGKMCRKTGTAPTAAWARWISKWLRSADSWPHQVNRGSGMTAPLVIIGTGLAGYNLAREFRKHDSQTPLLLITADDGRSYSKPMLSTGFAMGKDANSLGMLDAGQMAIQLDAEIRTHTRVTRLDPDNRRVWIGNEPVPYRDLVLAWGAQPIHVPLAGDATDRVFSINDLLDYG